MTTFKAGYYVDELNYKLEKIVGESILSDFYETNLYYSVSNLPDYLNVESINPLLKVAWNIISRGEPTRSSILVSENILDEHLGDSFYGSDTKNGEIKFRFNHGFFDELENSLTIELLTDFKNYSEDEIASNFGSKYLKLYRILLELIAAAQIQRTILLLLLAGSIKNQDQLEIVGVRESLKQAIAKDINCLFDNLNTLIVSDEQQLTKISLIDSIESIKINFNTSENSNFGINPFQPIKENHFDKILTDRKIKYEKLGKVIEEEFEKSINGEPEYKQRFEYKSGKLKDSLTYFLKNIFRFSEFKPGQEAIINRAIQSKDVVGLLPTGGGKSLTYQICSLLQPGVTIVVDPINSLMKDQLDKLVDNGITKTTFINSFNTKEERAEYVSNFTDSKYLILFVSPERFQIEKFRTYLSVCHNNEVFFSYAVIDEAHCVSEWGHDFRHTYLHLARNLKRFCKTKSGTLTLFGLTATASFDVLADVQRELEIAEDAIMSLPAEAIDRKELNYEIIKIDEDIPEFDEFYDRVNTLGEFKYPKLKSIIRNLPKKIDDLAPSKIFLTENSNFFSRTDEGYDKAGLIFCPTKSNKLKNGVLSIRDFLADEGNLEIGTFFGDGSDDQINNRQIQKTARESTKNQEDFINNETNLMIATKAFGMGIDKPNVRYTIHYTFPSSVESFYQESGRAGRNRNPSVCYILYHPKDIQTNDDFYQNSFKGIKREKEIVDELLDEVRYEDHFYLNLLKRKVQDKFPELYSMSIGKDQQGNDRYIYLNGPYKEDKNKNNWITIGLIDLFRNLRSYDNATKNFELQKAKKILDYTREILREECPNGEYLKWLKTKSADGIRTLIQKDKTKNYVLNIGFTNDTITNIAEDIKDGGYPKFDEIVIRSAYNFTSGPEEFIENLKSKYYKFSNYSRELILDENLIQSINENYYKIRNSSDTQRAIYRMSIAGIIDDYVIDYVGGFIEVRFRAKSDGEYFKNFESYLRRYLGNDSTKKWLKKAKERNENSVLNKVLYTLIEFIEEEISSKRRKAIEYMRDLCELGYEQGDQQFRDNIVYYFTSKYARTDFLPKDTDGGRIASAGIVKNYLEYIYEPPDNLGGQINNAKHLRGACENLRITMTKQDNASIDLLLAFSLFALEAKKSDSFETALHRPLIIKAIKLYKKGFEHFLQKEDEKWNEVKNLLNDFNKKVLDLNQSIEPLIQPLKNELLLKRTTFKLNQFLNKIYKKDG